MDRPNELVPKIDGKTPSIIYEPGYIITKPQAKYIIQAIEYSPIFLVTISDTSFF